MQKGSRTNDTGCRDEGKTHKLKTIVPENIQAHVRGTFKKKFPGVPFKN
jgi:hypothetical protein